MVRVGVAGGTAEVRCSTIADGDFHIEAPRAALEHRRRAFIAGAWTQLDEVHGTDVVVTVTRPGEHDVAVGDALVTRLAALSWGSGWVIAPRWPSSATTAGPGGHHAGWKGALAGVLPATVAAMGCAPGTVQAFLGPCIHPCCYEFGVADLANFVDRFGPAVAATTAWGTPALNLPEVVTRSLAEVGVAVTDIGGCTGCRDDLWFSHRRRAQAGRQVMTVCKRRRHERVRTSSDALVAERLAGVRERIARAGGNDVAVLAVTKLFSVEHCWAAHRAGCGAVGENYAQEVAAKFAGERPPFGVHFIGQLQTNKVRLVAPIITLYESVDRPSLVAELAKRARARRCWCKWPVRTSRARAGAPLADVPVLVELRARRGSTCAG